MSWKKTSNSVTSAVIEYNITLTNLKETANVFNKYVGNNPSKWSER